MSETSCRDTGSGEPLATATRLVAADQRVFHDPDHASALTLSVVAGVLDQTEVSLRKSNS